MVDAMIKIDKSEYNSKQQKVYEDLCLKGEVSKEQLEKISNMDELKKIFDDIVREKEEVLEEEMN